MNLRKFLYNSHTQVFKMPHCMVPGCTNHSKKTTGVSYHRLPQDKHRKAVWLARIPRANPCPPQYSFVCSAHFSPESFVTDLAEQLCGHNNRRRLTLNAVPTIFPQSPLYVAPRKPRLTSERLYFVPSGWWWCVLLERIILRLRIGR